jgi:geranylgeranyl reductase family protein
LTSSATEREEAEIAVVGAGPAGCTAAATLAELGHEVLLIDKSAFPRDKPCGDGLMRPAVAIAERLGLGAMLDACPDVESVRLVLGHRRQMKIDLTKEPGRCVPRKDFDEALLAAALERGARFRRARVESLEDGGARPRVLAAQDSGPLEVEAGFVFAADGVTSRLRRVSGAEQQMPRAYAIRRYFHTEKAVDPVFQVDVPIEFDGRILPGYGWVFPIEQHIANIGVGTYCDPRRRPPSLRRLLAAYLEELETKAGRRLGELEPIGESLGSPLGIRPRIEVAGRPGLILVGDAAGTTSPVTGEGISFAMRGAEEVAKALHRRTKRQHGSSPVALTEEIWPAFPQIGLDASVGMRVAVLKANRTPTATASVRSVAEPFLVKIWRILAESAYDTGIAGTSAWSALDGCDASLSASLERANEVLLKRLSDRTPFVAAVIHDSIQGHLGPMYAATVLATASNGSELPSAVFEAGTAAEAVGVLPKLLTMLVNLATSKRLKLNNAWAILTSDFAATRALTAAARLGPPAVTALSRACQNGCQGGMRDAAARFDPNRPVESWLQAAQEVEGTVVALATEFGLIVRGQDPAVAAPLREFALELGAAIRLAEEIVDLTAGEGVGLGREEWSLARGIYPLPILYGVEAEPSLARLLAQHSAEQRGLDEIIQSVRVSGALERAVAECERRSDQARACAEAWTGNDGRALAALASLPPEYVASRVPAAGRADAG